jgi:hypothetical protein
MLSLLLGLVDVVGTSVLASIIIIAELLAYEDNDIRSMRHQK